MCWPPENYSYQGCTQAEAWACLQILCPTRPDCGWAVTWYDMELDEAWTSVQMPPGFCGDPAFWAPDVYPGDWICDFIQGANPPAPCL